MRKNLKTVKTALVMGMLLFSVFTALMPSISAGNIVNLSHATNVTWASGNKTELLDPSGTMKSYDLDIQYKVTGGPGGKLLYSAFFLDNRLVTIKLEIIEKSSWCEVTIPKGTIIATTSFSDWVEYSGKINIQVNENAPALAMGKVSIKASVDALSIISGFEEIFDLEFQPAYLPMMSKEVQDGNSREIAPLETASFPIEITNLGNDRTKVFLEVENVPDGWIAVVSDDVTIDVDGKATAYLIIKPPKNFGYHYEEESFRVALTPVRAEKISDRGQTEYVTVVVESRGFSTPGFEAIMLIGALLTIALIFKKHKKI